MTRSATLIQGLETGTVRLAGHLPSLEAQAHLWQAGQHQPDCLAALTVAHDVLVHGGGRVTIVSPLDVERRMRQGAVPQPPAWMTRGIGGRRRTWRDLFTGDIDLRCRISFAGIKRVGSALFAEPLTKVGRINDPRLAKGRRSVFGKRDGQSSGLCRRVIGIVHRRCGFLGLGFVSEVSPHPNQSMSGSTDSLEGRV